MAETPTASQVIGSEFRDPNGRFVVSLPKGWAPLRSTRTDIFVFAFGSYKSPGGNDELLFVSVDILDQQHPLVRGRSLQERSDTYISILDGVAFPGVSEKLSDEMVVFAGVEARDVTYRRHQRPLVTTGPFRPYLERSIIAQKGDLIYIVSYHVPEEVYYTYLESVEQFLRSFEFLD